MVLAMIERSSAHSPVISEHGARQLSFALTQVENILIHSVLSHQAYDLDCFRLSDSVTAVLLAVTTH